MADRRFKYVHIAVAGRLIQDERVRENKNNKNNMPESPHHGTRMCRLQAIKSTEQNISMTSRADSLIIISQNTISLYE